MRENRTYGLTRGLGETHILRGAEFYSTAGQEARMRRAKGSPPPEERLLLLLAVQK